MKFHSTGGKVRDVSFEDAMFTGIASDGGLLMPEEVPQLTSEELKSMRTMSYVEILKLVTSKFITSSDISTTDLNDLIDNAFKGFSESSELLPLHQLNPRLTVLEMWHGRTLAFKDFGLTCLARLIEFFQRRRRQRAVALIATTGDTGSACLEAFKDLPFIDVVVLMPKGWCTSVQELQMTTVGGRNTHVIRLEGDPSVMDPLIKTVMLDEELSKRTRLFSLNSFNFGRILLQTAHHIFAYMQASAKFEGEVQIVIPCGGLGNITGGCLANAMGVPVRFVLCANSNDISHRLLLNGSMKVDNRIVKSYANAINMDNPCNFPRFFWLFAPPDKAVTLAAEFNATDSIKLPEDVHEKMRQVIVDSCSISNEKILETMTECYRRYGYCVCPHTACALSYCFDHPNDDIMRVAIATASPAKFQEAVAAAGLECPEGEALLRRLETKPEAYEDWKCDQDWTLLLQKKIAALCGDSEK